MQPPSPKPPRKLSEFPVLDGYRVLRELERGGMGEILLARDVEQDREVVIKWISSSESGQRGPEWKRRLEKETLVLSKIEHDHVVRILDSGADDEHAWLVMEFVEGGTLRDRISETERLPRSEVRRLLRELGSALDALHDMGIVHRDLKPENILLDAQGSVKVADFGLATPLGDVGNLTVTGQVLGTADYLSPEQKYRLPIDERSDQYALAVVAYELLTGRKPLGSFSGPSEKDSTLSPAVDAACLRALSEDPEDRFENVQGFVEALDAALATPTCRKFIQRPVPVIAGAVALGILIAGAWGFQGRSSTTPREEAPKSSSEDNVPQVREDPTIHGGAPPEFRDANGRSKAEIEQFNKTMGLALQFGSGGQWQKSLEKCDEALLLRPENSQVHYNRGVALHALGQLEEAVLAYGQAIHYDPKSAPALCNRGYLRELDQDFEGALEDFSAAIEADPLNPTPYQNRIQLLKLLGRFVEVQAAYEERLDIEPEDFDTLGSLAYLLVVSPDEAVLDVGRGLQLAEELCESTEWSHWRPLQVLAVAQHYSGQQGEGLDSAIRAVELVEPERRETIRDSLMVYFPELDED